MAIGQNEVETIFTANIANLQQGMATAQKGVQGFATATKGALASLAPLAAVLGISVGIQQSIKAFSDFETGLNNIRKQLGEARQGELREFEEGLKNLATTTGASLPELAAGLEKITDIGLDAG